MNKLISNSTNTAEQLRNKLSVTPQEYQSSVNALLVLAKGDTGRSQAAAQLLLSTFNGFNYQMNLTDFTYFDIDELEHALIVLRGRVLLSTEPHRVIPNGDDEFYVIQQKWAGLYTPRRRGRQG